MSDFKIVERLQRIDVDIQRNQLKYHAKRVLISKRIYLRSLLIIYIIMKGNVKIYTGIPIELY